MHMHVHTPHAGSSKHALPLLRTRPTRATIKHPRRRNTLKSFWKTSVDTLVCLSQTKTPLWDCLYSWGRLKTLWRLNVSNSEQNRALSVTSMCTCSIRTRGLSLLWTWECVWGTAAHSASKTNTHPTPINTCSEVVVCWGPCCWYEQNLYVTTGAVYYDAR